MITVKFLVYVLFLSLTMFGCRLEQDSVKVISSTPRDRETALIDSRVNVKFNAGMKPFSVEKSFSLRTGDSSVCGSFTWNSSYREMIFTPEKKFVPGNVYSISVTTDAISKDGVKLLYDYNSSFTAGHIQTPKLTMFYPGLSESFPIDGTILFHFDTLMDYNTIVKGFSITPFIEGSITSVDNKHFQFAAYSDFENNTIYTITLRDIYSIDGLALGKDKSFYFKTGTDFSKPQIVDVYADKCNHPENKILSSISLYRGVEKDSSFYFTFSKIIDRESFNNCLEIFPAEDYIVQWLSGNEVKLSFKENLSLGKDYTVTVKNSLKDKIGNRMIDNFRFIFSVDGAYSKFLEVDDAVISPIVDPENYITLVNDTIVQADETPDRKYKMKINFNQELLEGSFFDNVEIRYLYGPFPEYSGSIKEIIFYENDEARILLSSLHKGNVYRITFFGGTNGILSRNENQLNSDIGYILYIK